MWSINRGTFNATVKEAAQKKRELYSGFLKSVETLKSLDAFELDKVSDALQVKNFKAGEVVITEGEIGKEFYIIENGSAEARKGDSVVMTYGPASYFGELALLNQAPRAATVVTTEDSKILMLEEESFSRLLGNLNDLMKQKAAKHYA